jgi:organic hydroperoxide reductase OsmC/OhrA
VDNQPYVEAVMLGGANPGRGTMLVDSGACFTMVTEHFVEKHGYQMKPYSSSFTQAAPNSPLGEVIGTIDMDV